MAIISATEAKKNILIALEFMIYRVRADIEATSDLGISLGGGKRTAKRLGPKQVAFDRAFNGKWVQRFAHRPYPLKPLVQDKMENH